MKSPPSGVLMEGFAVSCLACAAASGLLSIGQRPLSATFGVLVLAVILGACFGPLAIWVLSRFQLFNASGCVVAGALIGLLPYAILVSRTATGLSAADAGRLLVGGAATGWVFWLYVERRMRGMAGASGAAGLTFVPRPPTGLADRSTNAELFSQLRAGHQGNEYVRLLYAEATPKFEARRVADISITVVADGSGPNRYLLLVRNLGSCTYENLRIHHEPLLLDAESFGLDTTHMPSEVARIPGEPVVIDTLAPGAIAKVVRAGYDAHDRYDGPGITALDLEFRVDGREFTQAARRWTQVHMDLPTARED